jgi:dihydrolipoamide dehydrogenase
VLATGSTTIEIPTFKFDGKQVIGAKEAVSLRQVPKRLCVIGGGIIGLELGMVYQKLGSQLTVLEALPKILTGVDAECAKVVERKIVKLGGKIHTNAKAMGYDKQADGSLAVKVEWLARRRASPATCCSSRWACAQLEGPRPRGRWA